MGRKSSKRVLVSAGNASFNKEADDLLHENGYSWNGLEEDDDTAKQEAFENYGIWKVPFRGASRLSPN